MGDPDSAVSVGAYLRALRLARQASAEDLARATRIGERQIDALESDRFGELPAPIFVRGFIRAYCGFLGEPPDRALDLYAAAGGGAPPVAVQPRPERSERPASRIGHPVVVSVVLLLVCGAGLVALNLASRSRAPRPAAAPPVTALRDTAPAPATPAPAAPAPATATPAAPAPATATPAAPAPPPAASPAAPPPAAPSAAAPAAAPPAKEPEGSGGQRLVIKAVEPTWIRVQIDEARPTEELLSPGTTRQWTADRRFLLTVGNAGGVELELNGKVLPSLGARGAVVRQLSLPASGVAP